MQEYTGIETHQGPSLILGVALCCNTIQCYALECLMVFGFAGVRPGERVVRYEDTNEGSLIHEQQLARQQQLDELEQRQQEQARHREASAFLPADVVKRLLMSPYKLDLCVSDRLKQNICITHDGLQAYRRPDSCCFCVMCSNQFLCNLVQKLEKTCVLVTLKMKIWTTAAVLHRPARRIWWPALCLALTGMSLMLLQMS